MFYFNKILINKIKIADAIVAYKLSKKANDNDSAEQLFILSLSKFESDDQGA